MPRWWGLSRLVPFCFCRALVCRVSIIACTVFHNILPSLPLLWYYFIVTVFQRKRTNGRGSLWTFIRWKEIIATVLKKTAKRYSYEVIKKKPQSKVKGSWYERLHDEYATLEVLLGPPKVNDQLLKTQSWSAVSTEWISLLLYFPLTCLKNGMTTLNENCQPLH